MVQCPCKGKDKGHWGWVEHVVTNMFPFPALFYTHKTYAASLFHAHSILQYTKNTGFQIGHLRKRLQGVGQGDELGLRMSNIKYFFV